jgi:hypothetical protein
MATVVLGSASIHSSSIQKWLVAMSARPVASTYVITSLASSKTIARNSKSSSVEVLVCIAGSKNERQKDKIEYLDTWYITNYSLTSFLTPINLYFIGSKLDWWTKVQLRLCAIAVANRFRLEWPSMVCAKSACFPTCLSCVSLVWCLKLI